MVYIAVDAKEATEREEHADRRNMWVCIALLWRCVFSGRIFLVIIISDNNSVITAILRYIVKTQGVNVNRASHDIPLNNCKCPNHNITCLDCPLTNALIHHGWDFVCVLFLDVALAF